MLLLRKQSILKGMAVGIITSLPVMLLSLLGQQLAGFTFLPFDIFDWLTHILPGPALAAGIMGLIQAVQWLHFGPTDVMINDLEQIIAILAFMALGGAYGAAVGALIRPGLARVWAWLGGGILLLFWLQVEAVLGFSRTSLGAIVVGSTFLALGWGWVMGLWAHFESRRMGLEQRVENLSRRRFLIYLGAGSLATILSYIGIFQYEQKHRGQFSVSGTTASRTSGSQLAAPAVQTPLPASPTVAPAESGYSLTPGMVGPDGRVLPAPGTRAEITPIASFYQVSIDSEPPRLDPFTWRLSIEGLVESPLMLSLDDLRALPSIDQVSTLSCQFNPVGGDLIGTARWTGTRLRDLLNRTGLKAAAKAVNFHSLDDYYESASLAEAMDERALLIYAMNGSQLSAAHGLPLRLFLPDRYGMKQPKWLSRITLTDSPGLGYWRDRQWDSDATVAATAVIDSIAVNQIDPKTGTVPVGGIAYAGSRGIRKVEIQIDSSPWMPVTLRAPALSQASWVQWRFNAPYQSGAHIFRVRATDGSGGLQASGETDSFPHGATGIFSYRVTM